MTFDVAMETLFLIVGFLRNLLLGLGLVLLLLRMLLLLLERRFFLEEAHSTARIVPLKLFKVPSTITSMFNNSNKMLLSLFIW